MFSVGLCADHGFDVLFYPPAVIFGVLAGACWLFAAQLVHPPRSFMGDTPFMLIA